ncbi:unnamed protein product [Meloidogyne enterolobii]|uniref:Uncharacterized protein n=1 Tax=Meloidogyne enterolobii TaxID=390850 RepID=A0ACB0Y847_MELEN
MQDVLGQNFYNIQLEIRKWFPFVCIAILCLTALILFSLQLIQKGHFKWSDNNKQSTKLFLLLLCRAILFIVCVHIPLLELPLVMKTAFPDRRSSNKLDVSKSFFNFEKKNIFYLFKRIPNEQRFLQEILIRIWQSLLIGLFEPLLDAFFLPQFPAEICAFFNLHEVNMYII